jgi:chromate reductase
MRSGAHATGQPERDWPMTALKILVIPGSLRSGSLNAKLAAAAVDALVRTDVVVNRLSLGDYPLPIYDGDLESEAGVPKQAINLKRMIGSHHGVLIVTPEYNSSLPPLLKNAIDWVSRVQDPNEGKGQVFRERPFAIAAASNGPLGGTRCLAALRLVLSACRATVIPNQMALSFAKDAYDETDRLRHAGDSEALTAMARQLVEFAQQMTK